MEPMKLKPAVKDYLWGGTRLREEYGVDAPLDKLAEAWMLSCHPQGEDLIENGRYQGLTLTQAIKQMGAACLGTHAQKFAYFPILIKLIDAKDNLSVQVHPDDAYARRVEKEFGKTEAWYILDAEEGAELIYGFRREIGQEEFRRRIADGTLMEVVNRVPVKKGDLFFIEAGTLHALGKGGAAEFQHNLSRLRLWTCRQRWKAARAACGSGGRGNALRASCPWLKAAGGAGAVQRLCQNAFGILRSIYIVCDRGVYACRIDGGRFLFRLPDCAGGGGRAYLMRA